MRFFVLSFPFSTLFSAKREGEIFGVLSIAVFGLYGFFSGSSINFILWACQRNFLFFI